MALGTKQARRLDPCLGLLLIRLLSAAGGRAPLPSRVRDCFCSAGRPTRFEPSSLVGPSHQSLDAPGQSMWRFVTVGCMGW